MTDEKISAGEKISQKQADEELDAWMSIVGLKAEPARMDDESVKGYEDLRSTITRALRGGHLTYDNGDVLELHLMTQVESVPSLKFGEPLGFTWKAMDKTKGDFAKLYAFAAAWTKTDPPLFEQLKERDLRVVRALTQIFLALK